ncbi:MAG: peptidylprolyl isomerase [Oscillibacter sp.]|nr:peptidylprolyl isomerase [Oscillibacter sp.]
MKRMVWCLTLVLCLLLSACGSGGDGPRQAPSFQDAAQTEETDIWLVVDGREVPSWRYLYWLSRACTAIRAEYEAAGLEPDWTAAAGTETLAEYVKQQALSDTVLYATVENWAEQYGCTAENAESQAAPDMGMTQEQADELAATGRMYAQLYELFCTEGSALAPAADELAAFAEEQGWVTYDCILVSLGEDSTAASAKAAELFSRLNAAADRMAEFGALAAETGSPAEARTVRLGDEMLSAVEEDALESLEEGQYSGILETDEGFCILRRLKLDAAVAREAYFDALLQKAADEAHVQCAKAYEELDVAEFNRKIQQQGAAKGEK